MPKPRKLDERIADLLAIDPRSPAALEILRPFLSDKSNVIIGKVAAIAERANLTALSESLESTFHRLLAAGTAADKGCLAKDPIAHALYQFGTGSEQLFLAGIHHRQPEPVLGGTADTAAVLRGTCALGLIRIGYRDALHEIADLLADPEPQSRILAARALSYSGHDLAALPLRVKILSGDPDSTIIAECLAALVKLVPGKSLPLLSTLLNSDNPDLANEAAVTLGSLRNEEAFSILRAHWQAHMTTDERLMLLTPLALLRLPAALDMLFEIVASGPLNLARPAAEALAMYRSDPTIAPRLAAARHARPGLSQ